MTGLDFVIARAWVRFFFFLSFGLVLGASKFVACCFHVAACHRAVRIRAAFFSTGVSFRAVELPVLLFRFHRKFILIDDEGLRGAARAVLAGPNFHFRGRCLQRVSR